MATSVLRWCRYKAMYQWSNDLCAVGESVEVGSSMQGLPARLPGIANTDGLEVTDASPKGQRRTQQHLEKNLRIYAIVTRQAEKPFLLGHHGETGMNHEPNPSSYQPYLNPHGAETDVAVQQGRTGSKRNRRALRRIAAERRYGAGAKKHPKP
mmetsp:Transcript_109656/g.194464  ORF Transcript_109656/g.194464 Transcript_109656/m.194464 type:complete len:153 (+) Transcript_109656:118-576(+)